LDIYETTVLAKALILLNSCAIYAPTPWPVRRPYRLGSGMPGLRLRLGPRVPI
jgi:hypothetical protein